jgi:hypothetical protein
MELKDKIEAAQNEVSELCKGKRFKMSIPVQETDTDVIISGALTSASERIKELEEENRNLRSMLEYVPVHQCLHSWYYYSTAEMICTKCGKTGPIDFGLAATITGD